MGASDARNSTRPGIAGAVGAAIPHDSGELHVSGEAIYTDVMTADDIPGENNCGPVIADDPVFAPGLVQYVGQAVFAVAATTVDQARKAAQLGLIEYEELEPILDPRKAVEAGSFVLPSASIKRGDSAAAIANAAHRVKGSISLGGQDQFYLEGQIAMAMPAEDGDLFVYSSTQYPGEVQHLVAAAIGKESKDVVVECRRMGGAFGGKESQPALIACIAGLMAQKTGKPCKLRLDRDDDMIMTGKRHDFEIDYEVGFDDNGRIEGIEFMFASRCGMSADLSGAINDRTMFHCDNAYFLENVSIVSHRCKTNTVSNTAFRGFGGPQGMFAIEYAIDDIARHLKKDPLDVRRENFYGIGERDTTQYLQTVDDNIIHQIVDDLEKSSDYRSRVDEIRQFNQEHEIVKRGIALTPVKFGISFTATHLNQAGALLHIYKDGTVHLNHGGTEMGQGLFTKVAQVVAEELQIDIDRIKITASDTSKVPNASATAASAGSDLNGKAAQAAARTIKNRLTKFAAERHSVAEHEVVFENNEVRIGDQRVAFKELIHQAWFARTSLSATGFYRTPRINYDRSTFSGRPFFYYAYGAAVAEVIIDTLTGEHRVLRVDILHDCGKSLNPAIDMGQIEGGFIQGVGWLTSEELWWNADGELKTHAPSTYKIPTCSDLPVDFRVRMLESTANREETIHRSKAVGEPPLMLSLCVFHAIRDAVASNSENNRIPGLQAPATPEAVLNAVLELKTAS